MDEKAQKEALKELNKSLEVYKCYKNKSVNSCDNEVTDFKKKNNDNIPHLFCHRRNASSRKCICRRENLQTD